jgi:hypothetical protein
VVELVGPAGCGKSTLSLTLPASDPRVRRGPNLWGLPYSDRLASAVELVPTALGTTLAGKPPWPDEAAQMVRIGALRRAVEATPRATDDIILVEEGAVFGLAWLEVNYRRSPGDELAEWRRRAAAEWAATLDVVVRLDAEDGVLARRIRTRAKSHQVKHSPDSEIRDFTARYRRAFDRVIADLAGHGRVSVLHLRTDVGAAADDALRLDAALEEVLNGD